MPGDRIVTQVFILQNESAVQLVPVLRPLVTANNFIARVSEQQRDRHHRLRRERAAHPAHHPVDRPAARRRRADHPAAERLGDRHRADRCSAWCPRPRPRRRRPACRPKAAVAVDPRTNSLLVRADNARADGAHQDARRRPRHPGRGRRQHLRGVPAQRRGDAHRRDAARRCCRARDRRAPPPPRPRPAGDTRHADHATSSARRAAARSRRAPARSSRPTRRPTRSSSPRPSPSTATCAP